MNKMTSVSIKKKEDLVKCLGKKIAETVLREGRTHAMKRIPFSASFTSEKPSFAIDDGGGLYALAFDSHGEFLGKKYCGSGDSAINFAREQFSEGLKAPQDTIVIFVERYQACRSCPWTITVVSDLIQKQVEASVLKQGLC